MNFDSNILKNAAETHLLSTKYKLITNAVGMSGVLFSFVITYLLLKVIGLHPDQEVDLSSNSAGMVLTILVGGIVGGAFIIYFSCVFVASVVSLYYYKSGAFSIEQSVNYCFFQSIQPIGLPNKAA